MNKCLEILCSFFELNIIYCWFSLIVFFLIFFCLFWDGFLVLWYGIGFVVGDVFFMFFLFLFIYVVVGIGLMYYMICLFVNCSYINVD